MKILTMLIFISSLAYSSNLSNTIVQCDTAILSERTLTIQEITVFRDSVDHVLSLINQKLEDVSRTDRGLLSQTLKLFSEEHDEATRLIAYAEHVREEAWSEFRRGALRKLKALRVTHRQQLEKINNRIRSTAS